MNEIVRNRHLKNKYGISLEQYLLLLIKQEGKCKICKRDHSEFTIQLAVDHSHETGKVRGLLCFTCNVGLGFFNHDTDLIEAAMNYLEGKI